MTGEITLRGVILPVGGIKEKVLAARRAGITNIILPKMNAKDLQDIESYVTKDLCIHFVENIEDVLKIAFPRIVSEGIEALPHPPSEETGLGAPSIRV